MSKVVATAVLLKQPRMSPGARKRGKVPLILCVSSALATLAALEPASSHTAIAQTSAAPQPGSSKGKPSSTPPVRAVSLAVYRGEMLVECSDMEWTSPDGKQDAGVPGCKTREGKPCSPEWAATGMFDAEVHVSYNNIGRQNKFHWTKLEKACAAQFPNRGPLATCQLAHPIGLTQKRSFYLVEQVFDPDAPRKWCGAGADTWKVVSRESEDYRREALIQATPDSPAFLPDGQDMVGFGKPTVQITGRSGTTVIVEVKNLKAAAQSCSITATFMNKDTILGTARGVANQIAANATKTAELRGTNRIRGYSVLKLQIDSCF